MSPHRCHITISGRAEVGEAWVTSRPCLLLGGRAQLIPVQELTGTNGAVPGEQQLTVSHVWLSYHGRRAGGRERSRKPHEIGVRTQTLAETCGKEGAALHRAGAAAAGPWTRRLSSTAEGAAVTAAAGAAAEPPLQGPLPHRVPGDCWQDQAEGASSSSRLWHWQGSWMTRSRAREEGTSSRNKS